jgi:hypothetical protein
VKLYGLALEEWQAFLAREQALRAEEQEEAAGRRVLMTLAGCKCGRHMKQPEHTCPYEEGRAPEFTCTCCRACVRECARSYQRGYR